MPRSKNNSRTGILTKWKTALLHLSIKHKFQNLTNYLITHGCNLDSRDKFGKTLLLKATYKLETQMVEILLTENADMMVSDSNGKNALQTALEFPSISECRPVIKSFATKIREICANDNASIATLLTDLECPLTQVVYFGDADLTRTMLIRGCKVNQRNLSDGNTALHLAVMLLDLENVEVLLQFGADRSARNNEGCMPFFSIFTSKKCENASAEILKLVMPMNVDWTKCDKDGRLKSYAIFTNSSTEFLTIFLKTYDVDLNAKDASGKTALHYLVERDKTDDSYDIFRTAPIDVNARDNEGRTPLHVAAMRGNADAVKFLLDKGADTKILYNDLTPIYLAFGREATIDPQRCIALLLQTATTHQLTSSDTSTIYMRIFLRFDDDDMSFCKSVTAHLALLEKANRPTLKFDPSVPFYASADEELEPYYRRIWRKRMSTVTMYHHAYMEQLEEIRRVTVYGSTTLFDVLVDDDSGGLISRYAWKSEERVEELRRRLWKETYAFYYKTRLTTRFENAGKLARWRKVVARIFSETGLFTADHVAVEMVVRMLEYDDLKRFGWFVI